MVRCVVIVCGRSSPHEGEGWDGSDWRDRRDPNGQRERRAKRLPVEEGPARGTIVMRGRGRCGGAATQSFRRIAGAETGQAKGEKASGVEKLILLLGVFTVSTLLLFISPE